MGWIPWSSLLGLLPFGGLLREAEDEGVAEERQRRWEEFSQSMQAMSQVAFRWWLHLTKVLVLFSVLFAVATMLYGLLYYLIIPARLHEQEIFFDYGNHPKLVHGKLQELTLPQARLNLLDPEHQWEASTLVPKSSTSSQKLRPGVKYDVYVELVMPESRANMRTGVFMVSTTLENKKGEILASSSRPAIVHDSSWLVRGVRELVWLVPNALRITEPSQSVMLLAVNGYEESKTHPLTTVSITLNTPHVQIYSATLTIIAQLSGVRYLMYHWSFVTAVLVILNLVFIEFIAVVILYAVYQLPQMEEAQRLSESTVEPGKIVDQGAVFEQHRSGGIPPVHVERSSDDAQVDSTQLLHEASQKALFDKNADEDVDLRFRSAAGEGDASDQ